MEGPQNPVPQISEVGGAGTEDLIVAFRILCDLMIHDRAPGVVGRRPRRYRPPYRLQHVLIIQEHGLELEDLRRFSFDAFGQGLKGFRRRRDRVAEGCILGFRATAGRLPRSTSGITKTGATTMSPVTPIP